VSLLLVRVFILTPIHLSYLSLKHNWEVFSFTTPDELIYSKPAIAIPEQIDQFRSGGWIIHDDEVTASYLQNISYYRLAGYWWPMQADKDTPSKTP
jgi:hypothetical protein